MIRAAEVSDLSPLPNEIQAEQGKERKPRYITNHFFLTESNKTVQNVEEETSCSTHRLSCCLQHSLEKPRDCLTLHQKLTAPRKSPFKTFPAMAGKVILQKPIGLTQMKTNMNKLMTAPESIAKPFPPLNFLPL